MQRDVQWNEFRNCPQKNEGCSSFLKEAHFLRLQFLNECNEQEQIKNNNLILKKQIPPPKYI